MILARNLDVLCKVSKSNYGILQGRISPKLLTNVLPLSVQRWPNKENSILIFNRNYVSKSSTDLNLLPDIDFYELQQIQEKIKEKQITLLDVRSKEEYSRGFIPGAINVPRNYAMLYLGVNYLGQSLLMSDEEFLEKIGTQKPPKESAIIVHCLLGIRARTGQLALKGAGYTNVRMYHGSFKDWNDRGGQISVESTESN